MARGGRVPANLATLANGLVGAGAVAYILAGNKLWGMLLVVAGVAFDGLDGLLSRRAGLPPSRFGRVADSVADAVTFGIAPAALLVVHTDRPVLWAPYAFATEAVGGLLVALAIARLVYFTLRGFQNPFFVGAPTPQTAIAVVLLVLFWDAPAFLGTAPLGVVVGAALASVLMVVPVRFPKIRRGHPLRPATVVTGVALAAALVPLQFRPAVDSLPYLGALGAASVAAVGTLAYYALGPWSVRADAAPGRLAEPE